MRILKIELQNINSIKSDKPIVIDFESERFVDVGLYAITGSTGAGKTTILDAITIAMYHSVPRFNKSNVKASLYDVVSSGANGAMARVVFENKGVRYESQWSMRLTSSNGKRLNNPKEEVRLKNITTERIIAEKKSEVKVEVEKITQLNYNQFLRSVMLAQGEFASFLSANEKDKGALLEQITGEEIYKDIGDAVNVKIYDARKLLEEIESKINSDDVLSDEKTLELKEEQKDINNYIKALDLELKKYATVIDWHEKEVGLKKTTNKLIDDKLHLEKEIDENKHILDALKLHEKAEPYKELVDDICRLDKDKIKKKERFEELNNGLNETVEKLKELQKKEIEGRAQLNLRQLDVDSWHPKLEKVAQLDNEIEIVTDAGVKIKNVIDELLESIKNISNDKMLKEEAQKAQKIVLEEIEVYLKEKVNMPDVEKKIPEWSSILTKSKTLHNQKIEIQKVYDAEKIELLSTKKELSGKKNILEKDEEVLGQLKADIVSLLSKLEALDINKIVSKHKLCESKKEMLKLAYGYSVNYLDLQRNIVVLEKEKSDVEKQQVVLSEIAISIQQKIDIATGKLLATERILELENTVVGLSEERKKLQKGKPCGLCGSTSHPLVDEYVKVDLSKTQAELKERKIALEELRDDKSKNEISIAGGKVKIESNSLQSKSIQNKIIEVKFKLDSLNSGFSINDDKLIAKEIVVSEDELKVVTKQFAEVQELQKQKDDKDKLWNSANEKLQIVKSDIVKLNQKVEGLEKVLRQREKDILRITEVVNIEEGLLREDLVKFDIGVPEELSDYTFIIEKLQADVNLFNSKTKKLTETENRIAQLGTDINHCNVKLKEKSIDEGKSRKELDALRDRLRCLNSDRKDILPKEITTDQKREELYGLLKQAKVNFDKITDSLNSLITDKATKNRERENIGVELTELTKTLVDKTILFNDTIKNTSFKLIKDVLGALLSAEEKERCIEVKERLQNRSVELKTLEQKLKQEKESHQKVKVLDITFEFALQNKERDELLKQQFIERRGGIETIFVSSDKIKERNRGVYDRIDEQRLVVTKWEDLMKLLGGSKHAFNTYVQRLTLHNLICLANNHLLKLNNRYLLKMNETYIAGEELNFKLIDHYQTNEVRFVETSSGGEKFLISLALALGLSDLVSNNVSIKSLFIDEGFGTLDNNTLETVISTLETLQAQGKMIGVISHVESLKERISTQIQVLKKSNGVSVIKII